jgi:hypothetical protein
MAASRRRLRVTVQSAGWTLCQNAIPVDAQIWVWSCRVSEKPGRSKWECKMLEKSVGWMYCVTKDARCGRSCDVGLQLRDGGRFRNLGLGGDVVALSDLGRSGVLK